jgi:hypothetical protein
MSTAAIADAPAQGGIRAVTDDEARFFADNGWVFLPGLVDPGLCKAMLERGTPEIDRADTPAGQWSMPTDDLLAKMSEMAAGGSDSVMEIGQWVEWRGAIRALHDPAFTHVGLDPVMGHNAQALLGRKHQVQVYHDMFVCKRPDGVSTPTGWHQDFGHYPFDRNSLTFWIALDEITPDMGPVRFLSGSHKMGMFGRVDPLNRVDLIDEYPELDALEKSPAFHMQPGDCTVHNAMTIHGAGANLRSEPRWSYICTYFPTDSRYNGMPSHDADGYGFKVGFPMDHPTFPKVPEL